MIRSFIFLSAIILLECCSGNEKENQFSGNWYCCSREGNFYELYIKDDSLQYRFTNDILTEWYKFKVDGDTLTYYNDYVLREKVITDSSMIRFINKNEIAARYFPGDYAWTYQKLTETIPENSDLKINTEGYQKRTAKYKCPDKRSREEKLRDSLEWVEFNSEN